MPTSTKQDAGRRAGTSRTDRSAGGDQSPVQRLLAEAEDYLAERAHGMVSSLTERISDAGTSLNEGGALGEVAKGLIGQENPVTALARGVGSAVKDKVAGRKGGGDGQRAVHIAESVDVGLPLPEVYNQWTQLTEFGRFTKGVQNVSQSSDVESRWDVKIWWSSRSWTAKITEQVPDHRIAWTSTGAKGSVQGVVTFHDLAPDLTRVLLDIEYYPKGFMEKVGNIWRAQGRRTRLDLKHFRRFVMMRGEATGEWRGEIRDGEVVQAPEQEQEQQRERKQRPRRAQDRGEDQARDQGEDRARDQGEDQARDQGEDRGDRTRDRGEDRADAEPDRRRERSRRPQRAGARGDGR